MKKLLLTLAVIVGLATAANAKTAYSRDKSSLPQKALATLSTHFPADVSLIKIEPNEYEVILVDGTEITFYMNGEWDGVDVARGKEVPAALVPQAIKTYVAKNYAGQKIESIDKERTGYDVELSNGLDLKFNPQGQFIGIDD